MLVFNKPYLTGKETTYVADCVNKEKKTSGNGKYTKLCQNFFQTHYGFKKCLLTTSCTDALEMAAILIDVKPGDEIIVPSYTFVSTALAFVRQGAKIIFADSCADNPNIDADKIEKLITNKTKAIVPVHYAGVACDMDKIMQLANQYNLFVIEDAAQAINSFYKGKPLGSIGHLATFSFHETKNIQCGEGGLLVVNDDQFIARAEIIWEKGTNRSAFWRGEVDKYNWVDIGSSFLPSDILASFLYAQLEELDIIQAKRVAIWDSYYQKLKPLDDKGYIVLSHLPKYATNNAHMFYIICKNNTERNDLITHMKENKVFAIFHYISLHKSPYYNEKYIGETLLNTEKYEDCLVRLPFFFDLSEEELTYTCDLIKSFYQNKI